MDKERGKEDPKKRDESVKRQGNGSITLDEVDSDSSSGSFSSVTWIKNFCSMVGHELFCEVDESFIFDEFNLTGLPSIVPHYKHALELILDLEPDYPHPRSNIPIVEQSAEVLYGLIHARFIISKQGLQLMARKYQERQFGTCPRYYCSHTALLPVGRHDSPGFETVRLFCPCCMDIYLPSNSRYLNIDGSFFGTSFVGLFLKTYPDVDKACKTLRKQKFELKIYGFRISELSKSGPRMKWLRQTPDDVEKPKSSKGTSADQDTAMSDLATTQVP